MVPKFPSLTGKLQQRVWKLCYIYSTHLNWTFTIVSGTLICITDLKN